MRNAKHVLTAAVASGRVVLTEKLTQRASKNDNKDSVPAIDYHMDSTLSRIDQVRLCEHAVCIVLRAACKASHLLTVPYHLTVLSKAHWRRRHT